MTTKFLRYCLTALMALGFLFGLAWPSMGASAQSPLPPTVAQAEKAAEVQAAGLNAVRDVYAFEAISGTYTEITGGTLHGSGISMDENNYNNIPIGFTFIFNNTSYTSIGISANGFMRFGATSFSGTCAYTPISSTDTTNCANLVSAQGEDLQGNTGATLRSELLGTSPNRVFVIQWKDFRHYSATSESYNFQVQLYEGSNEVRFVYGPYTKNSSTRSVQVGLKGASTADYENRTTSLPTNNWSNPLRGTASNATMTLATSSFPASGQTYVWTPPPPAPSFVNSTKTAPAERLIGETILYTIAITNSGSAASTAAEMTDPLPALTDYVDASLTCTSGTCTYDDVNRRITWQGAVAVGETVTVTYSVEPADVPCGASIQNTATIVDATALPQTVTKTVTTRYVATTPDWTQSFDDPTFPPTGWSQSPLIGSSVWDRQTSGANPPLSPHSGAGMARWNAYSISNGNATRLATPTLTLPADSPRKLSFYMSHDPGFPTRNDRIEIQISTDDGLSWIDWGISFSRYDPAYTTPGWGLHTVDLTAFAGQTEVKVGFKAVSAYGNNFFLDDVQLTPAAYPCPCTISAAAPAWACQLENVTQTLTISCVIEQTLNLSAVSNSWIAQVSPASITVPAGSTVEVTAITHVPLDAQLNDTNTVLVAADTQGNPDLFYSTTLSEVYNGVQGAWQAVEPLPAGRVFAAQAVTNAYVFVIGGTSDAGGATPTDTTYRYSIVSNTWQTMAPAPVAFSGSRAVVLDGKIYIPGYFTTVWSADTLVYDIVGDTWQVIPGSGTFVGATQYAAVTDGELIYRLGGLVDNGSGGLMATNAVWVFDPVAQTWTEGTPFTTARTNAEAMAWDGNLYLVGGASYPGFGALTTTEIFDGSTWTMGAALPTTGGADRWTFSASGFDEGALYLFGGRRDAAWAQLNHTGLYNAQEDMWMTTPLLPTLTMPRTYLGGGAGTNFLWATGGRSSDGVTIYPTHERLTRCIPTALGVEVLPAADSKPGLVNSDVTYTLALQNTGNVSDAFDVAINSVWPVQVSPAGPYMLAAGATQAITVTVSIPADALNGATDAATLTFSSGYDPLVNDTAVLTTSAVILPGFSKDAPDTAQIGEQFTYTITFGYDSTYSTLITDQLPLGVEFVTGSLVVSPAIGTATYSDLNRTITWSDVKGKRSSAKLDVTIEFDVIVTAEKGETVTNQATLTYATFPTDAQASTLIVNTPPVAEADAYTMDEDTTLTVLEPGVLLNDEDADDDELVVELVTAPATGSLTLNPNGSFSYSPSSNYFGEVTFTYRAYDGTAYSAPVTVTITINNLPDVPLVVNDAYTMDEDTTLTVVAPGVLGNDSDPNGDPLQAIIEAEPLMGDLTLNLDGSFTYTPPANYFGEVTFTYRAYDGIFYSEIATVTITVSDVSEIKYLYLPAILK